MKNGILKIVTAVLLLLTGSQLAFMDPGAVFFKQRIPPGFPAPVYDFKNNPVTKDGFELGKRLFYDGRIAGDGQTACASCHQQFAAFADFEHVFSHGALNRFTNRNAPPLFNLAWHKEFHADGAINHIEWQPLAPLTGHNEMNNTIEEVIGTLQNDITYKKMFKKAFGTETIESKHILYALTQFTGSLVSADSRYDRVKAGKDRFTEWEEQGYRLFLSRCAECHTEPLFTDLKYHNIGLPVDSFLNDYGRMVVTGEKEDSLKFKTPSLRNITRTEPYMHDGRFWGLSTAINHWQTLSLSDSTASSILRGGSVLDKQEIRYLVSFLYTLTDTTFLTDKRFADPIPGNLIHAPFR